MPRLIEMTGLVSRGERAPVGMASRGGGRVRNFVADIRCLIFFFRVSCPLAQPPLVAPAREHRRVFNIIHHVSGLFVVENLAEMDANATIMASPVASVGNDYNPQSIPSQIKYLADLCANASPWTVTFAILAAIIAYDQS